MSTNTSEQRFEDLEIKLAYQEHTIGQLNDVVLHQQKQLDRLEQLCQRLADRLQSLTDAPPSAADERPPHY